MKHDTTICIVEETFFDVSVRVRELRAHVFLDPGPGPDPVKSKFLDPDPTRARPDLDPDPVGPRPGPDRVQTRSIFHQYLAPSVYMNK